MQESIKISVSSLHNCVNRMNTDILVSKNLDSQY